MVRQRQLDRLGRTGGPQIPADKDVVDLAIDALPPSQRAVIVLRDVEGWSSEEVCNALELTETNQRVLLHRARSKVRKALEEHLG